MKTTIAELLKALKSACTVAEALRAALADSADVPHCQICGKIKRDPKRVMGIGFEEAAEATDTAFFCTGHSADAPPEIEKTVQDIAKQLNHLAKTAGGYEVHPEDAPEGPFRSEPHDETRWRVICDTDPAEDNEHFYGSKDECDGVRDVLNRLKINDQN